MRQNFQILTNNLKSTELEVTIKLYYHRSFTKQDSSHILEYIGLDKKN